MGESLITKVACRDCLKVYVHWGSYCRLVARLPLPADVVYRRQFGQAGVVNGQVVDVLGSDHAAGKVLVQPVEFCPAPNVNEVCERGTSEWVDTTTVRPGVL